MYVGNRLLSSTALEIIFLVIIYCKAKLFLEICTYRAGHKLEAALEQLEIDVTGKVALDSGLSTGGFTDCLLQYGASFIYGVDVGYGQVRLNQCFPLEIFAPSSILLFP